MKKLILIFVLMFAVQSFGQTISWKVRAYTDKGKLVINKKVTIPYKNQKVTDRFLYNQTMKYFGKKAKLKYKVKEVTDKNIADNMKAIKPMNVWGDTLTYIRLGENVIIKRKRK